MTERKGYWRYNKERNEGKNGKNKAKYDIGMEEYVNKRMKELVCSLYDSISVEIIQ
jgi:hypothetical protein